MTALAVRPVEEEQTRQYAYALLDPMIRLVPWETDRAFQSVYDQVRLNTLVDGYRCYELWSLVQESAKCTWGAVLEVGAWRGGSGCLIAQAAKLAGITDPVYLADTFTGLVKHSAHDPLRWQNGDLSDASVSDVWDCAQKVGVSNVTILAGVFPEETGARVTEALRFVHIDVDFYQSALDVFEWAWPRVVAGGIVVFDDYGFEGCAGVTQLVESLRARIDTTVIYNLNGHAVVIKR